MTEAAWNFIVPSLHIPRSLDSASRWVDPGGAARRRAQSLPRANLRPRGKSDEAARLAGITSSRLILGVFTTTGVLTALAALLNAVRFSSIPSNAGLGLELKVIAAVVVGGTTISGGRGSLVGTLIGTALLGTIGTALTFLGINPFWEKAIQGAIILAALSSDVVFGSFNHVKLSSSRDVLSEN